MATYYVGPGGNNSNNGTTWALRKLTLNGAEDIPVQAGDTVYVGAGTYRELLTCDVSGSSGSPITYIGDYTGANTDGTGGVVRITGSNDDKSATRNAVIAINSKEYRTFRMFHLDSSTADLITASSANNLTLQNIYFGKCVGEQIDATTLADNLVMLIDGCVFGTSAGTAIYSASIKNASNAVISNCIFNNFNENFGIRMEGLGDLVIKNCTFRSTNGWRNISNSPESGHPVVITNCIFENGSVIAKALGDVVEDYNYLTSRTNVAVGAHSVTYLPLFDSRWFFEMVNGGSMLTPYDLASYSQLINVAGTSPTTADMRGTTVQGTQREWGALEYDSTLDIEAGSGGGAVSIQPLSGRLGL